MNRLAVTLTLLVAIVAVVLLASGATPPRDERGAEFQRLVGGLGLGPAPDASRCESAFDPRLCPHCSYDLGPIPGGMTFCPHHGGGLEVSESMK